MKKKKIDGTVKSIPKKGTKCNKNLPKYLAGNGKVQNQLNSKM